MKKHPGFTVEFNRPRAYRARLVRFIEKFGFAVEEVNKTAFIVRYDGAKNFSTFKRTILSALDPLLGSATVCSGKTGRRWKANNKGNRPRTLICLS